ncbi:phosphonate ABC transporter ATP-binding protein [Vibrio sp. 10N.286.49.C2]|uniref:putative 2-aminoethylphosphonate ABC transporter ATP-binding protein n=1 Tax=unclassified Vibrio TaxID=2614977 RepID=UPI000C84E140|nr:MULTISPECIES: putative 2-aminoethylphosphonate ABC transporter ATP-binding protein [unclassified Vibrio]PMH43380.1 phosphonate ABC transporter ATP-binding protein [Vibrio sp. 10N.286.49.C2]PMH57032.1 phosphonate ABC transporter ATP-binding protein [Vibrio sp. 10N.286.49.B1]PMH83014.1 phosphonate ABC transporter ATP-binding protein [Vibrio sp. 10N.286.48.B7]
MTVSKPYLDIQNVVKQFGQFTALKEISLSISRGEFVCFLGPSGCGKTTLLRAIAGLDLPTSGRICQDDKETTFLPPEKRDFGIVFQSYALFPNLTVQENIAVGLKNQGLSNKEALEKVEHWLEMIGLPTSGNKFPNQLSGGQQQRVALARALALSPGLLLLDEPLSALDAKVRTHLRDEICQMQRRLGITTIMVTHDQEEALSMADRIVVMNHGVIEQVGTPQEIYEAPATRFVADFVGSMNFIEASVASSQSLRVAESMLPLPELENMTLSQGDIFELAVRPENIQFVERASNAIPVRILAKEFQGAFYRVEVAMQNAPLATPLYIDVPVKEVKRFNLRRNDIRYIEFGATGLRGYLPESHVFKPVSGGSAASHASSQAA